MSSTNGVPVTDVVINQWWATGFTEGEQPKVGVTTDSGNYVLQKASKEYSFIMKDLEDKVILTKMVIEIIAEDADSDMSYNDFLLKLTNMTAEVLPHFTEETLLNDAEFVINQIESYEGEADLDEETHLMESRFVHKLISYSGIRSHQKQPKKSKHRGGGQSSRAARRKKQKQDRDYMPKLTSTAKKFSKATTTPLVR